MITNKEFAQKVLSEAEETFKRLNSLLLDAQESLPPAEFNALRKGIGYVVGYLYTDVQAPIYKSHPEMEPPELRRSSNEQGEI
jgi:hypothetical protein